MSTSSVSYQLSADRRPLDRSDLVMAGPEESRVVHSYGDTFARSESVKFHPAQKSSTKDTSRRYQAVRTKRRLKGFLVELQGNEARVAFVENGETVFYDLPADQIRRAGIELRNQPFQMDEIETKDEHGSLIVGYRFLALAKPSDAYIETLNFDDERKRKRAFILKEFGQAQV